MDCKSCKDCLHYEVCNYHICEETDMTVAECTHFTDTSEWVHSPCKEGDSIFCDGELFSDRYAGKVMEFTAAIVRTQVCTTHCGEIDMIFNFKDFGKTVFLTREDAEKALKKSNIKYKKNLL